MICKFYKNSTFIIFAVVGIVCLTAGVFGAFHFPEEAHTLNMLSGFLTGLGLVFTLVGLINLIRLQIISPEKIRQEEINRKDERNVLILRYSAAVVGIGSFFVDAALMFVLSIMNQRPAAYCVIGAMYLKLVAFFIARKIIAARV